MFHPIKLKPLFNSLEIQCIAKFKILTKSDRKHVQKRIDQLVKSFRVTSAKHEYYRAIGNSFAHGKVPIKCKIYLTKNGQMICIVKDYGKGFDYKTILLKFHKGEVYYQYHGLGFKSYAQNQRLIVDWRNRGRTIILYYK